MSLNEEFMTRFTEGLMQLVIDSSLTDASDGAGQRVAMIQAAEMIETMIAFIAILSRDSNATTTPKLTREWTDRLARRLRVRIAEAKREPPIFNTFNPGQVPS